MKGLEFGWSERLVGGGRAKSLKTWADQNPNLTGPQSKGFGPSQIALWSTSFTPMPHLVSGNNQGRGDGTDTPC
jgi:hypothetical protein